MKNKGAKQKQKRKGAASAFGCDLTEYLESSGQDGECSSLLHPPPHRTPPHPIPALRPRCFLLEGEVNSL